MSLTVVNRATPTSRGHARDRVRCDCGFEFFVRASHRNSGKVTKCCHCEKHDKRGAELAALGKATNA